jgi:hypothetical protein
MLMTLLSETNNSSCSRREAGMCALTVASRFSLRMGRKILPASYNREGNTSAKGGETLAGEGGVN